MNDELRAQALLVASATGSDPEDVARVLNAMPGPERDVILSMATTLHAHRAKENTHE